jgi:hypothetical protein
MLRDLQLHSAALRIGALAAAGNCGLRLLD